MRLLQIAIEAAEARKQAVLGEGQGLSLTDEDQSRAIISGFDLDYDEFREIADRVGVYFASYGMRVPPTLSHEAAWTDGLLIGLFAASLPPTESGGKDAPDSGDGDELH